MITDVNTIQDFDLLITAFREEIQGEDFVLAQARLDNLSRLVARNWPALHPAERDYVHCEFMAVLRWSRLFVEANREHLRVELERINGAKIYQMPDPRTRWNVQG